MVFDSKLAHHPFRVGSYVLFGGFHMLVTSVHLEDKPRGSLDAWRYTLTHADDPHRTYLKDIAGFLVTFDARGFYHVFSKLTQGEHRFQRSGV